MTLLNRIEQRIEEKLHKSLLRNFSYYINPFSRLGVQRYSFGFPFLVSLIVFIAIEVLSFFILHNNGLYSGIVIVMSITLILYFSFRDAFVGGFTTVGMTVLYYLFIILSKQYSGSQLYSGIQTTILLGIVYLGMSTVIAYLKHAIDILIGREMEARILAEENERRLSAIMQQLPIGVLIVDKKRRVEGNKQLISFLGKEIKTSLRKDGKSSSALRGNLFLEAKDWPITRALTKGETISSEEIEYVRKDKKHVFLRVSAAPIKNAKNQIIAAVSTIDDITEKKQEEEAKYRLAALVESSEDAIMGKTLEGIITTWNKGAEKLLGYTSKEAVGQSINLIIPKNLRQQEGEIIQQIGKGKSIEHIETLRLKKNKQTIPVSMSISPVTNNKGEVIGVSNITRDITGQKELEKQKDNFIATASHELKTPLTSLKGFTHVLHVFAQRRGDEKSLQLLDKMNGQLTKLTNLIGDLLDITKMQSGQLPLNVDFFDFDSMLRDTVESMQLTTEKHEIVLQGNIKREVYGDKERTEQVIINLLSNAIKYSPNAKEIIITAKVKKSSVEIAVRDFGIGIPKKKQKSVFRQFFRVSGPSTETFPGLGLGLYISSEIMKRLGGEIWVDSSEGKGSTFHMSVPIQKRRIM